MPLYREFCSIEEIDKQYNVAHQIDDFTPYIETNNSHSRYMLENVDCDLDIKYGLGQDESIDIYPSSKTGSPVLIFIHGGYWHSLDRKDFSFVAAGPLANDITVMVVDYSLCPKVNIEDITKQNQGAIEWIYHQAERFNGDQNKIFVAGHSAGAQQVAMMLDTPWQPEFNLPDNIIKGGIAISGIYDLTPLQHSWLQPVLNLTPAMIKQQSPLLNNGANLVPLLISYGVKESEEFHRQSIAYHERKLAQGNDVSLLPLIDEDHLSVVQGLYDPNSLLCIACVNFINKLTR